MGRCRKSLHSLYMALGTKAVQVDKERAFPWIIVVASLGKFGGGYVAARLTGSDWREAASLGVLLNTRGLVELIVLNLGLDLHVLSPTSFTMFVLMAVTATLATTPILQRIMKFTFATAPTVGTM